MTAPNAIELYADYAHGLYIPQHFAESCSDQWRGITCDDRHILLHGPEHPLYWDAWCAVVDNAHVVVGEHTWRLWQDGDLWAVCDELMTRDEYEEFYGEERVA